MEEKKDEKLIKCANDLKVNVTKLNGEILMQEDCCTMIQLVLKNTGEMATSFFGAHNPQVLKVLEKAMKGYFKTMKRTLKKEFARTDNEEIEIRKDELPEGGTWADLQEEAEKDSSSEQSQAEKEKVRKARKNSAKKSTKKSEAKVKPMLDKTDIKTVPARKVSPNSPQATKQKSTKQPHKRKKTN